MEEKKTKTMDIHDLIQDDHNFNKGTEEGKRLMQKSFSELGAGRSILVDKDGRIISGNKSQIAAIDSGIKNVRVIETDGTELIAVKRTDVSLDSEKGRRLAYADNLTTQVNLSWDEIQLQEVGQTVDMQFDDWGFRPESLPKNIVEETEEQEIERKKREFEEKMASGALSEDDPEYKEFLKKFEVKKTTDDCYTPELVYEAVADWVSNEYHVSRSKFKRPFYPGGDYQKEKYEADDVVVDNPPFSILSEILQFYQENNIKCFLFGPHLTLFSSNGRKKFACIVTGVPVIYANKANVNTSFITNLEPENVRFRSEPRLYKAVKEANEKNLQEMRKELPKYAYPKHLVTVSLLSTFSRYGIDYVGKKEETELISELDAQKESKKAIFGNGFLVSNRLKAEREKAEREKAEREKAEREKAEREKAEREKAEREKAITWELSERELAIIAELDKHSPK